MNIYVLFGHRKEKYEGEFAPEALAVASQFTMEENPEFMRCRVERHRDSKEFAGLEVVKIAISCEDVMQQLYPKQQTIIGKVS